MQLHHIVPEADGGDDTAANCIPLCLECHEEVGSYNPSHPIGRKFSAEELRRHRDVWFDSVKAHPERLSCTIDSLFRPNPESVPSTPEVQVKVEPHYHECGVLEKDKSGVLTTVEREVFAAKVRNQGSRSVYVEVIGFTCGEKRYPGLFSPWSSKDNDEACELSAGRSQVFSFFGVKLEEEDIPKFDGMYVLLGSGQEFVNRNVNLERLLGEWRISDDAK